MLAWIRRKFFGGPCHIAYDRADDWRLRQGLVACRTCGVMHLTKPQLSDAYIRDMVN